ncbi:hypothetical protein CDAR_574311 [Caerostris darwini]|uniref:Uncharacterized protein n=1 Tax=Caerostris darwini TaxID=1538125 RepID=A0AAV4S2S9_9ARAC|nr:hypothetical protein CDAR_574311 [Caerostris darwini]
MFKVGRGLATFSALFRSESERDSTRRESRDICASRPNVSLVRRQGHQGIERRRKIRNEESGSNSTPLDLFEFKGLALLQKRSLNMHETSGCCWMEVWGWFFFVRLVKELEDFH